MTSEGPALRAGWFRVTVLAALAAAALTALAYAYVTGSSLLALGGVLALAFALIVLMTSFPRSARPASAPPQAVPSERAPVEHEHVPAIPIGEAGATAAGTGGPGGDGLEEPAGVDAAAETSVPFEEPARPDMLEPAGRAQETPEETAAEQAGPSGPSEPCPPPSETGTAMPSVRMPATLAMDAVAAALLESARSAGDAVTAHIWLEDPASGSLRLVAQSGSVLTDTHPQPLDTDPLGPAATEGTARLAEVDRPRAGGETERMWRFALPIRGDGTRGVAAVDFEGERPDRAALVLVTSQLRGALTGGLALHVSQTEMETARLLLGTARELSRNLDPHQIVELALERAMSLSDAVSGSVMLLEGDEGVMTIVASRGLPRQVVRETRVREGEGIAGWVLATRQPMLVEDQAGKAARGRRGVRSSVCVPLADEDGILGVLNVGGRVYPARFTDAHLEALTILGRQTAVALRNARALHSARDLYFATLRALALALETKDPYAHGLTDRVVRFATALGQAMGLDEMEAQALEVAALLHDIGMSATGDVVAACDRPLSTYERGLLKLHPVIAAEILQEVPALRAVVPIVYHHHEWYDGRGYVVGLAGESIPLGARILAVADAFVAMTSERPYRSAKTTEGALEELRSMAGSQFDPEVVDAFVEMLERNPLLLADAS